MATNGMNAVHISLAGDHEFGGPPQPPSLLWSCSAAPILLHCNRLGSSLCDVL